MKVVAVALLLAACSGDPPSSPDASTAKGAFGATCSVTSDMSTECESGVCTDSFDMLGHDVCSQKCDTATPTTCPSGSMGQKCNMKGYCKP